MVKHGYIAREVSDPWPVTDYEEYARTSEGPFFPDPPKHVAAGTYDEYGFIRYRHWQYPDYDFCFLPPEWSSPHLSRHVADHVGARDCTGGPFEGVIRLEGRDDWLIHVDRPHTVHPISHYRVIRRSESRDGRGKRGIPLLPLRVSCRFPEPREKNPLDHFTIITAHL